MERVVSFIMKNDILAKNFIKNKETNYENYNKRK